MRSRLRKTAATAGRWGHCYPICARIVALCIVLLLTSPCVSRPTDLNATTAVFSPSAISNSLSVLTCRGVSLPPRSLPDTKKVALHPPLPRPQLSCNARPVRQGAKLLMQLLQVTVNFSQWRSQRRFLWVATWWDHFIIIIIICRSEAVNLRRGNLNQRGILLINPHQLDKFHFTCVFKLIFYKLPSACEWTCHQQEKSGLACYNCFLSLSM